MLLLNRQSHSSPSAPPQTSETHHLSGKYNPNGLCIIQRDRDSLPGQLAWELPWRPLWLCCHPLAVTRCYRCCHAGQHQAPAIRPRKSEKFSCREELGKADLSMLVCQSKTANLTVSTVWAGLVVGKAWDSSLASGQCYHT